MSEPSHTNLARIKAQVRQHLYEGIIPFWASRAIDHEFGGYLTCIDAAGNLTLDDTDKYIVTQTRMIWGLSAFSELLSGSHQYRDFAVQGVDFFIEHFWDHENGGWAWKVKRDGTLLDKGKVVYGQSFAIYALAQYTLSTEDPRGLEYAARTFDLLQKYCADTSRGGYYENLDPDWQLSAPGFCAGDRKSLDIHMHLMEAYTTLYQASGEEVHRRRLEEVMDVILRHMIDYAAGCGGNQFDLQFQPVPPIAIRRTWNAERKGDSVADLVDTTSYGHNVELAWLLVRAGEVLGKPRGTYAGIVKMLVDHTLAYGFDWERGGVYRDGPHIGPALVTDKEFWQNAEALVGLLDAYEILKDDRYLAAFSRLHEFVNRHMINHELGEWLMLVSREGKPLWPDIGNPWKACYHTGRAAIEVLKRIELLKIE